MGKKSDKIDIHVASTGKCQKSDKKHITSNRDREGMNEKKRREEQYVKRREEHRRGWKTQYKKVSKVKSKRGKKEKMMIQPRHDSMLKSRLQQRALMILCTAKFPSCAFYIPESRRFPKHRLLLHSSDLEM
jgi:hypothetical protein